MKADQISRNNRAPKKALKVLYIFILLSLLWGALLYLDMLNEIGLQNLVSVFLGFFTMLLIHMRIISYFFSEKMQAYNLDEFGIIKDLIKSKIFGEINSTYLSQKIKAKYYQHTKDQNDKLFFEQNSQTFDCVMTTLRAKTQTDHLNKIKILKEKWEIFLFRVNQLQTLMINLYKVSKERILIYKKFIQKTSSLKDADYESWDVLFFDHNRIEQILQNKQDRTLNLKQMNPSWLEMKKIILERVRHIESNKNELTRFIFTEFKTYVNEMKGQHRQTMIQFQNCENENILSKKNYRQIIQKIDSTNKKINTLTQKIKKTKTKSANSMETIFNLEYDLRFLFVELDNLQVRKTYAKDMNHKNSEAQYKLCESKEKSFQNTGINTFNKRINHYFVNYYEKKNLLIPKIKQRLRQTKDDNFLLTEDSFSNPRKTFDHLYEIERRFIQFESYLPDLIKLFQDEIVILKKGSKLIKQYNDSILQLRYTQDASISEKIIDNILIKCVKSTSKKESEILENTVKLLREQQNCLHKKGEKKSAIIAETRKNKKDQTLLDIPELKVQGSSKIDKSINQSITSFATLEDARHFELENKVQSFLHEILLCMFEGYTVIIQEVQSKKQQIQSIIKSFPVTDPKIQRMNEYKDELFKLEREEFLKEEQNGPKDQTEANEKSLAIANKLLSVFFSEWRNSQFFHQILKQQIQLSLNTKRSPLLGYMTVKYIKVHEKEGDILENLTLLGNNLFVCLFEVLINFRGKICLHIETQIKGKRIPVNVRILITEFVCPIRICFTPFSLGKSYVSMMKTPKITAEYSAKFGNWDLAKIPFLSTFIEIFIVIKLRKKFLYPKRSTIKVPLAVKNAIAEAIKEETIFEKLIDKKKKAD